MWPRLLLADSNAADGVIVLGVALADTVDYVRAANDPAEDAMVAVAVGSGSEGDEELGAAGVGAGVGHAEDSGAVVREDEGAALVVELISGTGCAGANGVSRLRQETVHRKP